MFDDELNDVINGNFILKHIDNGEKINTDKVNKKPQKCFGAYVEMEQCIMQGSTLHNTLWGFLSHYLSLSCKIKKNNFKRKNIPLLLEYKKMSNFYNILLD